MVDEVSVVVEVVLLVLDVNLLPGPGESREIKMEISRKNELIAKSMPI